MEEMDKETKDAFEKSVVIAMIMLTAAATSFKIPGVVLTEALRRLLKQCEEISADVDRKSRVPELEDIINSTDMANAFMVPGNDQQH